MSLQWSQPLNLSQVPVYSLGCEHGRRWILKHSIVIKYTKVAGMIEFMYMLQILPPKEEKFIRF
jgi:hypothetical protein